MTVTPSAVLEPTMLEALIIVILIGAWFAFTMLPLYLIGGQQR